MLVYSSNGGAVNAYYRLSMGELEDDAISAASLALSGAQPTTATFERHRLATLIVSLFHSRYLELVC